MKSDYSNEEYVQWKEIHGITFYRKLENETAFDGMIKIYSFYTGIKILDNLLQGEFFGDFFFESEKGLLLRKFLNKDSWPNTILVHLDLESFKLNEIFKTNSSYSDWPVINHGEGKYAINISPAKKVEYSLL